MTKTRIKCGILILCALTFFAGAARAEDGAGRGVGTATGLPLPRFVSLKSDEVNARVGPGADYQIAWVFRRAGLPVEVLAEFENWRQIRELERQHGLGQRRAHQRAAHGRGRAVGEGPLSL